MKRSDSRALMMRELDEQAAILLGASDPLAAAADRVRPGTDGTLWVGGCGDSLFAAQALARHFRGRGWDMRAASAAELLWDAAVRPDDAVVGISISGSTRRTAEALTLCRDVGASTIAVTLNPDSALARAADATLVLPFTPISRAIPHGLDYHMTLLAVASLAGQVPVREVISLLRELTTARLADARTTAASMGTETRFVFLGAGPALGSAGYGAAKMQEAGGLAAWAFEAEGFCHGAQFMLRPGDHVVLCGTGGAGDARTLTLRPGLEQLVASVGAAGFDARGGAADASLLAAFDCALYAQALCLAVAERLDLNVADPAQGSGAAEVQREWFSFASG